MIPVLCLLLCQQSFAQEMTAPLGENAALKNVASPESRIVKKPTALGLPFFEDFTDDSVYPSSDRWTDKLVYVNNHMAVNPPARGVATFDALNQQGVPYDSVLTYHQVFSDSLTSQMIDLSSYTASDSIYLSFFYEPKGLGFAPKANDSLMLYLHSSAGSWNKVWATAGDTGNYFRQVMIPIAASEYFYSNFDFRFVNKATHGISNSQWHVDYIRLDAGRNINDTTLNDVAFTTQPGSILGDFTSMPFRHFDTDRASFMGAEHGSSIKNNSNSALTVNYSYTSKETTTPPSWGSGAGIATIAAGGINPFTFPVYSIAGFTPADADAKIVFENRYVLAPSFASEPSANDSIRYQQVFDDYFAYDDGTAEQSYFLNLSSGAPGKIAIEYALYRPDTITGIAIRFVRQVPSAANKDFSLAIYTAINPGVGTDEIAYQQDFYLPSYQDTVNQFSYYKFDEPVIMDAGIFFVGVIQPAGGISDSLSIALDRNRVGGNHRYYNVGATWEPSLIDGALMVRPLVGNQFFLSANDVAQQKIAWSVYPNPATQSLQINMEEKYTKELHYTIHDLTGRIVQTGMVANNKQIDISALMPGMYLLNANSSKGSMKPLRFVKM